MDDDLLDVALVCPIGYLIAAYRVDLSRELVNWIGMDLTWPRLVLVLTGSFSLWVWALFLLFNFLRSDLKLFFLNNQRGVPGARYACFLVYEGY